MSLLRPVQESTEAAFANIGKEAAEAPELSYSLAGRLYLSASGWLLLSVPNALMRGAFDALHESGIELPPGKGDGQPNAHISVMSKEDVDAAGGPDKITERGHTFGYTLGPVRSTKPDGWPGMEKVWFITVRSPALEKLRKSYGLSPVPGDGAKPFHISIAVRRSKVLQNNDVSKAAEYVDDPFFDNILTNISLLKQQQERRKANPAKRVDSTIQNPLERALYGLMYRQ